MVQVEKEFALLTENVAHEQLALLLRVLTTSTLETSFTIKDLKIYPATDENNQWIQRGTLKLKELPEWLFGFELTLEPQSITFYGDHRWLLDKFETSECYVNYEDLSVKDFYYKSHILLQQLKAIEDFPIRHFGYSLYHGEVISDGLALKEYEQMKFERRYYKRLDKALTQQFFDYFKTLPQLHPCIESVGIIDQNKLRKPASKKKVRYRVRVLIKPGVSKDLVDSTYAFIDGLIEAGVFKGDRMSMTFDGIYDSKSDLKKCHYLYHRTIS